jgi:hypothetical protein
LHLPQGVISNVKGKQMENPEYTESQINQALKAQTDRDITVQWDGYEPESGGTADFEVYLDGETTNVVLWDHGDSFDIYERDANGVFHSAGWARLYDKLATKITNIIEEDIASGKLGEYA